jgi:hypothetical protein
MRCANLANYKERIEDVGVSGVYVDRSNPVDLAYSPDQVGVVVVRSAIFS